MTIIILALILDAIFGEPDWLWSRLSHPAVLMGRLIGWLDQRWNGGNFRKPKGVALVVLVGLLALVFGWFVQLLPGGDVMSTVIAAFLLAHRSLVDHVRDVASSLRLSVEQGQQAVARIVGRDTIGMSEPKIARAAIESAAENFSDGVIAPVFWFLLLGLPGMLFYKAINTADSMIGYKNQRYAEFGWAAARIDDVLNWVPARLSAVLIALANGRFGSFKSIRRDAPLHRSPNAGWPEAAMAICLNTSLAGPRSYGGTQTEFPWVHPEGNRAPGADEINSAVTALWRTWALALIMLIVVALV